jgi:hypothetical protein
MTSGFLPQPGFNHIAKQFSVIIFNAVMPNQYEYAWKSRMHNACIQHTLQYCVELLLFNKTGLFYSIEDFSGLPEGFPGNHPGFSYLNDADGILLAAGVKSAGIIFKAIRPAPGAIDK